jgi:shikimate dehydrogenase
MKHASPDAGTRLYGLFGDPVSHSLSPLLHNSLFREKGINAAYLAFQVKEEWLGLAFESMRAIGIGGVNLTIPHKEEAVEFVDDIPEDVDRAVGALNTVVNRDGRLLGYNTDVPGFLMALREEFDYDAGGKSVVVAGAGGAASAVVFALARAGAEQVFVVNRTTERAEGLAAYASSFFPKTDIEPSAPPLSELKKISLVVNATSLGMHTGDAMPVDLADFGANTRVYDLVYSSETPLLKAAKKAGLRHTDGLGMLVNQAALAFELWTGERAGVRESMREIVKKWRS